MVLSTYLVGPPCGVAVMPSVPELCRICCVKAGYNPFTMWNAKMAACDMIK